MSIAAMVLAAGRGERIAPLSLHLAKPALPVLGVPLVLRTARRLAAGGASRLAVNLHHRGESVREALSDVPRSLGTVHFSSESELLGTGGGVRRVLSFLGRDTDVVVVWNGDAHADVDLAAAVDAHRRGGRRATIVLVEDDTRRYGAVRERNGRITGFDRLVDAPPPGRPFVFSGIHLLDPAVLERLPAEGSSDLVLDLYRPMLDAGEELGAFVHPGRWIEIGDPRLYRDTILALARGADDAGATWIGNGLECFPREAGRLLAGPGADASHAVRVEGAVVLEAGAAAAEGVRLRDSLLLAEATVGPGASLTGSVIGPGATVAAGLELADVVAVRDPGPASDIPPGARREHGLVISDLGGGSR